MTNQTIITNTKGTLKLYTQSITSAVNVSRPEEMATLKLSANNKPVQINIETTQANSLKLNSVNISDLSIEVVDTIQLPYGQEAYVRNIGTTKKAKLVFGIPQGETGNGIDYIELYNVEGAYKTYRIHYTDGNYYDYVLKDGSDAEWGSITGNISNQSDLQEALNAKADNNEVVKSVQGVTPTNGNVDIIPDMSGQSGKILGTDGVNLVWLGQNSTYTFNQAIASNTWIIQHNQNKYPAVSVVDSAGTVVRGKVEYLDENTVRITFNGEFKGKAYLN